MQTLGALALRSKKSCHLFTPHLQKKFPPPSNTAKATLPAPNILGSPLINQVAK